MRMVSIFLKGYKRIKAGLGLDEIFIDLSNAKHNVIIIKGDNGSGKSTLLNTFHPLPDDNNDFISGIPATKRIVYFHNGIYYTITYQHGMKPNGTRDTAKGFISKTIGEELIELNPNGNIRSCIDVIYSEFNLDANFVSLSSIGSENRGLADKRPSERKQVIASILDNLETYNSVYKTLTKRSSIFKSMINSITTKIANLGDPAKLQSALISINNRIDSMNKEKDSILIEMAKNQSSIENFDPNGQLQKDFNDTKTKLDDINKDYNLTQSLVDKMAAKLKLDISNGDRIVYDTYNKLKERLNLTQTDLQIEESKIANLLASREAESALLNEKSAKLYTLTDDWKYDEFKAKIDSLTAQLQGYTAIVSQLNMDITNISSDELVSGINTLMNIKEVIFALKDEFDYSTLSECIANQATIKPMEKLINQYAELDSILYSKRDELAKYEALRSISKSINDRPVDCNIDTCPYIKDALDALSKDPITNIERLSIEIQSIEDQVADLYKQQDETSIYNQCCNRVKSIYNLISNSKPILLKLPNGSNLSNVDYIFQSMFNGNDLKEIDELYSYLDIANVIDLYKSTKYEYDKLSAELKTYDYKTKLIDEIQNDINSLNSKLDTLASDIEDMNANVMQYKTDIMNITYILEEYDKLLIQLGKLDDICSIRAALEIQYETQEKEMESINQYIYNISILNQKLSAINLEIGPLITERDKIKHGVSLIEEYNMELADYKARNEKIEIIKYYSSPTTGIQTIFMSLYMNKIITISNQLLSYMFNGEFILQPFIINEKEFRIPCIGNNMLIDDISSMSTSQICMISMVLSFSLIYQASPIYRVLRLDEIDGGLDTTNRAQFIGLLYSMMEILQVEQCFMISHNNEAAMNDVDIILLKDTSNEPIQGNIVFNYNN